MKSERHNKILEIISEKNIDTQEELKKNKTGTKDYEKNLVDTTGYLQKYNQIIEEFAEEAEYAMSENPDYAIQICRSELRI